MKPPWFLCFWDDFRVTLRAWRGLAAFRAGCLRGTDLEVTYRSYLEVAYRLAAAKIGVPLDCRPQMAPCILSVGTTGSLGMICGLVNVVAARLFTPRCSGPSGLALFPAARCCLTRGGLYGPFRPEPSCDSMLFL